MPIHVDGDDRDALCQRACASVWHTLGDRLMIEPEQWESWRYVDLSLDLEDLVGRHATRGPQGIDQGPLRFNDQRYMLSLEGDEATLYDRLGYRVIPINRSLFDELARASAEPGYKIESRKLLRQCVDLGVLIS